MNLTKLIPWNWLKTEEEQNGISAPIQRRDFQTNPIMQFHQGIDRMFDQFFQSYGFPSLLNDSALLSKDNMIKPNVDITDTDKNYSISVEIPGVDKDSIQISLNDGNLTIRGEKKQEKEEKDRNYHRIERSYGSFQRVLSLPPDADSDKIDASFKNGVLIVTLPKIPGAKSSVKTIPIH